MDPAWDFLEGKDVNDEGTPFIPLSERKLEDRLESAKEPGGGLTVKFWISAVVNTVSTVALASSPQSWKASANKYKVFVNKMIFETKSLRHAQITFAAFHFAVTTILLFTLSHPIFNVFQGRRVGIVAILPLALGMIFNVVLQNLALANGSIEFCQVIRAILTPMVALLNFALYRTTLPLNVMLTLIPICIGVAVVSYFDTRPNAQHRGTSPIGALFAICGVVVSAMYTILIGRSHKKLDCTSQQLLFNQAPISVALMMIVIPFMDDAPAVWTATPPATWQLIILSGFLAFLLNLSMFMVIDEGGAISSTVLGHFKLCCGMILGWAYSGKPLTDMSLIGLLLVIGGIAAYAGVVHSQSRTST